MDVIQQEATVIDIVDRAAKASGRGQRRYALALRFQAFGDQRKQHRLPGGQKLPQLRLVRYGKLCRVGRCGRTQVGNKIGDRDVRLVADGGDDRNLGFRDRICHTFIVEGPEVLNGTAAPSGDDQIRHMIAVGIAQGADNLRRGLRSLHPHSQQHNLCQRIPLAQNPQHVMQGRAGR